MLRTDVAPQRVRASNQRSRVRDEQGSGEHCRIDEQTIDAEAEERVGKEGLLLCPLGPIARSRTCSMYRALASRTRGGNPQRSPERGSQLHASCVRSGDRAEAGMSWKKGSIAIYGRPNLCSYNT